MWMQTDMSTHVLLPNAGTWLTKCWWPSTEVIKIQVVIQLE